MKKFVDYYVKNVMYRAKTKRGIVVDNVITALIFLGFILGASSFASVWVAWLLMPIYAAALFTMPDVITRAYERRKI